MRWGDGDGDRETEIETETETETETEKEREKRKKTETEKDVYKGMEKIKQGQLNKGKRFKIVCVWGGVVNEKERTKIVKIYEFPPSILLLFKPYKFQE